MLKISLTRNSHKKTFFKVIGYCAPCAEGDPVEGVVNVGEDVEQVGGVQLACV